MKDVEEIFDKIASKMMVNWDFDEFKKSHPSLYKAIIISLLHVKSLEDEK
jgi:hypothetical protein